MSDREQVLAANAAFYRAFTERDPVAMESLWSATDQVLCVHPGWRALHGRDEVLASWFAILANPEAPRVSCRDEEVRVHGDLAFVLCIEDLPGGEMSATNVFAREDGDWRLVHHHAGPIASESEDEEPDEPDETPTGFLN
ncbi:nuclear transport factor 2 family protein [bacterium]|nr:nuclear transport factor 2 family protein [bacterium]